MKQRVINVIKLFGGNHENLDSPKVKQQKGKFKSNQF